VDSKFQPVPDVRELSYEERRLVDAMLEQAKAPVLFFDQLRDAYVVARCPCGCPSIDVGLRGRSLPTGPTRVLADFVFGSDDDLSGIFVFEQDGLLGGIELYALANGTPFVLPSIESLRPFEIPPSSDEEG